MLILLPALPPHRLRRNGKHQFSWMPPFLAELFFLRLAKNNRVCLRCACGAASVSRLLMPPPVYLLLQHEEAFRAKMRLVLNEWVAATVQLYFGKATPENDDKFHAFLRQAVPLEVIFGKEALEIDPLERLHPLELTGGRDGRGFPGDLTLFLAWCLAIFRHLWS